MNVVRSFFLALAMLGVLAAPGLAQNRLALVIGNNNYANVPQLAKAVGDARAMKARLEQLGFRVDLVVDADRRNLNVAISAFTAKLQPGDVALAHYSGHGVTLDGENFLLPVDVPAPGSADKELIKSEAIGLTSLIERIKAAGARTQIFIIDACRDNPYAQSGSRSVGTTRGLTRVDAPKGTFIMYSAGYGQTALDRLSDRDNEPTSVYTRVLLRKMVEAKPITELAREIRDDVEAAAGSIGHQQRPAYYDELSGAGFFFVAGGGGQSAALPQVAPPAPPPPVATQPPAPPPQQQASLAAGMLFPDSDRRFLSAGELRGLSREQLRIARNEIFARRGRFFKDRGLAAHFSRLPWYRPSNWDDSLAKLNPQERANVQLIQSLER